MAGPDCQGDSKEMSAQPGLFILILCGLLRNVSSLHCWLKERILGRMFLVVTGLTRIVIIQPLLSSFILDE